MDMINAGFNWVAAAFILINALDIHRKKSVAGHTYPSTIFFTAWSFFSIPYFLNLGQLWTVTPTIAMAMANSFLLGLVLRYRRAPKMVRFEPPPPMNCRCVLVVNNKDKP
jgi:hypothetical protein